MVALSLTENEPDTMLEGVKEMMWTSRLLQEIGMSEEMTRELRCNNLKMNNPKI